ncbi:HoxN/HupN/NixA family nickel/cobalt transporter [Peribacillus saganii]|nr:sulfite exporter TauE/SafE family protein [Peribacillus saganii]
MSILGLGFLLGVKHAIEPDHVIAISTIASRSRKLMRSSLTGVFWGIGHTATLLFVGMFIILAKGEIPELWAMSMEFLVGIMIVYFGLATIVSYRKQHIHTEHDHDLHSNTKIAKRRGGSYRKSMFMALIHGLAGSASMVLLTMSTVNSSWGAIYILVFGVGTIAGMLLFTTIIGIPFVFSGSKRSLHNVLTKLTGACAAEHRSYHIAGGIPVE